MITVAIPTLARRDWALAALRSVVHQVSAPPYEVLVLDNGCDPLLREQVKAVGRTVEVPVVYVPVPAVGLHNCRHEAARRGRGEILAYIDDDVLADSNWLAGLEESYKDPTVHMAGGRCLPAYEVDPPAWVEAFWTRAEDGSSWCGPLTLVDLGDEAKDVDPLRIWGANFSIRKETLRRVGGFHPDAVPWSLRRFRGDGETAVSVAVGRLGLRAAYSPRATVYHRVPAGRLREEYFERRAFLQGISDSFTASRAAGGAAVAQGRPEWMRQMRVRAGAIRRRVLHRESPPGRRLPQRAKAADAHAAGYAYHQMMLASDLEVQRWLTLDDYWQAGLPIPAPTAEEDETILVGTVNR